MLKAYAYSYIKIKKQNKYVRKQRKIKKMKLNFCIARNMQ